MPLSDPKIRRCVFLFVMFLSRPCHSASSASSVLPHKALSLKNSVNHVVAKTTPSSLVAGIMTKKKPCPSGGGGNGIPDTVQKIWCKHRSSCLVLLISILLAVIWLVVDASWALFLYDLLTPTKYRAMRDKTVWVTGASSGIGAELVCRLVSANASHIGR